MTRDDEIPDFRAVSHAFGEGHGSEVNPRRAVRFRGGAPGKPERPHRRRGRACRTPLQSLRRRVGPRTLMASHRGLRDYGGLPLAAHHGCGDESGMEQRIWKWGSKVEVINPPELRAIYEEAVRELPKQRTPNGTATTPVSFPSI